MRDAADEQLLLGLLGVDAATPWEEVRSAFRSTLRASHPDLNPGDAEAEQRVKALNAAWEAINTREKWEAFIRRPPSRGGGRRGSATRASAGTIRVVRQRRGSAGLLDWWLELDGTVVASIENGGNCTIEAAPGPHSLRVFYGARSSLPLAINLQRGRELLLGCRQLEGVRVNLFARDRCLLLERLGADGRPLSG